MGLYDTFETDGNLEKNGVTIDYGEFRVLIASAGQGNPNYVKYAEKRFKPVRKSMDAGTLSNKRAQGILADIYARTIVLNWETKVNGEWQSGIEDKEGNLLPFTPENVEQTFLNLPHLFMDIQEQATTIFNFRKAELERDAKN